MDKHHLLPSETRFIHRSIHITDENSEDYHSYKKIDGKGKSFNTQGRGEDR
jgi:hypothetical protein